MSRRKILIIDDELDLSGLMREVLSEHYEVMLQGDGEGGLRVAREWQPDLLLLDLRLPGKNGLLIAEALRQAPETRDIPIIMLTGHDAPEVRALAFRMGVDDYLSKPFTLDEFSARIESKIRRIEERQLPKNRVQIANLWIDRQRMSAGVGEEPLVLSALEYRILDYFVSHPEEVLSRERLLQEVWKDAIVSPRTVDTHVSGLRKKLAKSQYQICALYGAGYVLKEREKDRADS
ncbi:MAG: hypothetical protein RJB38_1301 [Pseudomonadota bacterium]